VPRSFPVPKKKPAVADVEHDDEPVVDWQWWALRGLVAVAAIMAGAAIWLLLRPGEGRGPADSKITAGPSATEPARTGPPDPAVDLYFTPSTAAPPEQRETANALRPADPPVRPAPVELPAPTDSPTLAPEDGVFEMLNDPPASADSGHAAPVESRPEELPPPAPQTPLMEKPPEAAAPIGELERRYLAALDDAKSRAPSDTHEQFDAEIERVKRGEPLPPLRPGLYRGLSRLLYVYRREKTSEPLPPLPPPEARDIEIYLMGGASVTLLLNGREVVMLTSRTWFSEGASYETQKAILTVRPGDVLGFYCREQTANRYFGMAARAGRLTLFGSDKRWDATVTPDAAWWTGAGVGDQKAEVQSNQIDYPAAAARGFQHHADVRFSSYDVIWAGGGSEAAFRYVIRAADLPKKTAERK
jgi:hypothetical protein